VGPLIISVFSGQKSAKVPSSPRSGTHLFRKPIELLQGNLLRHPDREANRDAIERRISLLKRLDVLDQVISITAYEAASLDRILDARQLSSRRTLGIAHHIHLLLGDRTHETQLAKHLHALLVILRRFLMPCSRLSAMYKRKPKHSRSPSSIGFPSFACAACQSSTTLCIAPPSAEPPPTIPWMPCLAMNSSARAEPPWIGCQHSTGRLSGRGTRVSSSRV